MIIFLNGSLNTGKSTIAKLLGKKLPNCAVIEIDRFHEFISWLEIKKAVPINLENAVSVIKNFARRGFNVVVPYPLSEANYQYLIKELSEFKKQIRVITLAPSKKVALSQRGSRVLDDWEKGRINLHYQKGLHRPSFGQIIDNSSQSPQQTLVKILALLKEAAAGRQNWK